MKAIMDFFALAFKIGFQIRKKTYFDFDIIGEKKISYFQNIYFYKHKYIYKKCEKFHIFILLFNTI